MVDPSHTWRQSLDHRAVHIYRKVFAVGSKRCSKLSNKVRRRKGKKRARRRVVFKRLPVFVVAEALQISLAFVQALDNGQRL